MTLFGRILEKADERPGLHCLVSVQIELADVCEHDSTICVERNMDNCYLFRENNVTPSCVVTLHHQVKEKGTN
jgi:hypothetical protein